MKKKVIIIAGILILVGIGFYAYNKYKKCPCSSKQTPEQAINNMKDDELREQIKNLNSKIDLAGKTTDDLRNILKELIK